jgi:hypothetical protein
VVPSILAGLAHLGHPGVGSSHLVVVARGLRGCVLVTGQRIVHASLRSADLVADVGRVLWTGESALLAMSLLCNRPIEVEIASTAEPIADHAPNVEWTLITAMLEMAVAIDKGTALGSFPCLFEPARPADDEQRGAPTRRSRD